MSVEFGGKGEHLENGRNGIFLKGGGSEKQRVHNGHLAAGMEFYKEILVLKEGEMVEEQSNKQSEVEHGQRNEEPMQVRRQMLDIMRSAPTVVFGVLFYLIVAAFIFSSVRAFLFRWWWAIALAIGILVVLSLVPSVRERITTKARVALVIFVVIPLFFILIGAVVLIPPRYQVAALRGIFLIIVCFLPAIMYYLFITTTKFSLFNEFIANLERLGFLRRRGSWVEGGGGSGESADDSRLRLLTYLRKFEAAYGSIPTDACSRMLVSSDPGSVLRKISSDQQGAPSPVTIFASETRLPIVLATVLMALGWLIALPPWQILTSVTPGSGAPVSYPVWLEAFNPEKTPIHFAFLGAYFFSIQMLFRRYVRRDLRATAYVAVSLRIILAVIGTWVAVTAVSVLQLKTSPDLLLVIGFVIGAFPPVVWQVIQATLKKFGPTLVLPSLQSEIPLSDLDGLTVWHQSRLEEEDIENVPNMATADIVELMLNTRLAPDRIIDWVDQAILYTHLGPERQSKAPESSRQKLRAQGIRTASALVEVYNLAASAEDRGSFQKVLRDSDYSPVRSLVEAVGTNPNLRLIQTWRGLKSLQSAITVKAA
jgi:hypothetical protein